MTNERWRAIVSEWQGKAVEITEVIELRDWSQSRVLRITARDESGQRVVYAKQARSDHAREAAIYQLAKRVADFPAPSGLSIVIDGDEWLLIEQAAGEQLARCKRKDCYCEAVRALADFHQQSCDSGWLEMLPGLENILQTVDKLAATVIPAVQQCAVKEVFTGLDQDLAARVQADLDGQWPAIRDELAAYPMNLIHGDSHGGNIFIQSGRIQFVDWGSAALAPGMLDLVGLLDVADRLHEPIGSHEELMELYWRQLSECARQQYGSLPSAYRLLQICRSLLELKWFSLSGDDYGERASRELNIIASALHWITHRSK